MNPEVAGGPFGRTTIRGSDAEGGVTLKYRPTRTGTAPVPGPTSQSEEGEPSRRSHYRRHRPPTVDSSSSDEQLTYTKPRERRRASHQVPPPHPPPPTQPTRPGSHPVQTSRMSSAPRRRRAALANDPPRPLQDALWSVLGATGHSDDDDSGAGLTTTQLRTARERYSGGRNPSPRRSRFRRAVRRVVTDLSFRIGESIGRVIGRAFLERTVGDRSEENEDGAGGGGRGGGGGARVGRERRGEARHETAGHHRRPRRAVSRAPMPDQERRRSARRRMAEDVRDDAVGARVHRTHRQEPRAVSPRPVADDAHRRPPRRRVTRADIRAASGEGHTSHSHGRRVVTDPGPDGGHRGRSSGRYLEEQDGTEELTGRRRFEPRRRRRRSTS